MENQLEEMRSLTKKKETGYEDKLFEVVSAKNKLETHVKDLRKTNAQLKEQFQKSYLENSSISQESEKLREELNRLKSTGNTAQQSLINQKSELEKELKDAKEKMQRRLAGLEEELEDLKTIKLPEKEKEMGEMKKSIDDFSNRVADLNREKVNAWREYRILGEKYVKLQEIEAKLKEQVKTAHNELEESQDQLIKYQKTITMLEKKNKMLKLGHSRSYYKKGLDVSNEGLDFHSISGKYSNDGLNSSLLQTNQSNN